MLGLVVAIVAYLVAPAAGAVATRPAVNRAISGLRRGRVAEAVGVGPVGPFVHAHLRLRQGAALGLGVLTFVFLDQPTGFDILLLAFGPVIVLAVIRFLDQLPPADDASAV